MLQHPKKWFLAAVVCSIGGSIPTQVLGQTLLPQPLPESSLLVSPQALSDVVAYPSVKVSPSVQPLNPVQQVAPPPKHLGNGPIDLNRLPPEVLNCDVCRQRLGLPPLNAQQGSAIYSPRSGASANSNSTVRPKSASESILPSPKSNSINVVELSEPSRMLGTPGIITAGSAAQLANQGLVVEEFKPPQPQPGAIQLESLPLEARQQFMKDLELPFGARVMSANIVDPKVGSTGTNEKQSEVAPKPDASNEPILAPDHPLQAGETNNVAAKALGAPGIALPTPHPEKPAETELVAPALSEPVALPAEKASDELPNAADAGAAVVPAVPLSDKQTEVPPQAQEQIELKQLRDSNIQLQEQLAKQLKELADAQAVQEKKSKEQMAVLVEERDLLRKEKDVLIHKLEQLQQEWKQRIAKSDEANREVLQLLEKRTAEVTELQAQVQGLQEATKALPPAKEPKQSEPRKKEKKPKPTKPGVGI